MKDILTADIELIMRLTAEDLGNPDVYEGLVERIYEAERTNRFDEAIKIASFLETFLDANREFGEDNSELGAGYRRLIVWCKFIAFHLLLDSDSSDLIKNHLVYGIRLDIDIREKVKTLFTNSWDPFLRGEKRDALLRALSQNKEQIGTYKMRTGDNKHVVAGTVSGLILDYNRFSKTEGERGSFDEAGFINGSPNLMEARQADRDLALKILRIYDFVRFPPLEEMVRGMVLSPVRFYGETQTVQEKRTLPSKPLGVPGREAAQQGMPPIDPVELLKKKYHTYRLQRDRVLRLEDEIVVTTHGDVELAKRELSLAAREGKRERVIACLKVLARQDALRTALRDNPSWFEAVSGYIRKRYDVKHGSENVAEALSAMKAEPATPAAVSEFLQYILKERVRLTENDSALIGVEIGQVMGGKFQGLAYGSQQTGGFEWAKNAIKEGRLVSEIE